MTKIVVTGVMKVIDVHYTHVSQETREHLAKHYTTYRDQVLKEHLIDIEGALEDMEEEEYGKVDVMDEVKQLAKLASKRKAAYVRFTT